MDLAPGLRGSLLPRKEDSIPSWSQLLTLNLFLSELLLLPSKILKFSWVIELVSKVFSLKYVQVGKEEKVKRFRENDQ